MLWLTISKSLPREWQCNCATFVCLFLSLSRAVDNAGQITRVPVFIKVMDINDNAPEFAMFYETYVCENVKSGQVKKNLFSLLHTLSRRHS